MEVKTNGLKMPNGDIHAFIPPSPTETERGGIKAKDRTTESLEVVVDSSTGKAYVPNPDTDSTLTEKGVAADSKVVGNEFDKTKESIKAISNTKADAIIETETGEVIKTEISSDSKLVDLKVFGKSEQVVTNGYQLFDASKILTKTLGGATVTNNGDGSFTVSGSGNLSGEYLNMATYTKDQISNLLKVGKLKVNAVSSTYPYGYFRLNFKDGSNKEVRTDGSVPSEIDITQEIYDNLSSAFFGFYGIANNPIQPGTIKLMLYQDGDGTWEPFTKGKPAPAPDNPSPIKNAGDKGNVEVKVIGKNLLGSEMKYANYNSGVGFVSNDIEVTLPYKPNRETYGIAFFAKCRKGEIYTLSITNANINAVVGITEYRDMESAKNVNNAIGFIQPKPNNVSYAANSNGILLCFVAGKWTNGTTSIHECTESELLQLESGEKATSYEPYRKPQSLTLSTPNGLPGIKVESDGNYTDSNGQQWICDEIDLARGKYVQRIRCKRIPGTASFTYSTITKRFLYTDAEFKASPIVSYNAKCLALCTHFIPCRDPSEYDSDKMMTYINGSSRGFAFTYHDFNGDIDKWKKFLIDNEVYVVGVLDNLVEHDLTPEEVAAFKTLHTNYPTTVISNDENAGMEVSYVADTKKYIDKKFEELNRAIVNTQIALL